MPRATRKLGVALALCIGMAALSYANQALVKVEVTIAPAQLLLLMEVAGGGGSVDETAACSPGVFRGNPQSLTLDLSNAEWIPEMGTSTFTLQINLVMEVRSNVPWILSAELEPATLLGKLEIRSGNGPSVPLNASTTRIQQEGLGTHTLYLQLRTADGIPQEAMEAISLILLLQGK